MPCRIWDCPTAISITGQPPVVRLGSYGDITLVKTRKRYVIIVRSPLPGTSFTIGLDRADEVVVADILEAVGLLIHRHLHLVHTEKDTVVRELAEMVTGAGWECTGTRILAGAAKFSDNASIIRFRPDYSGF